MKWFEEIFVDKFFDFVYLMICQSWRVDYQRGEWFVIIVVSFLQNKRLCVVFVIYEEEMKEKYCVIY